MELPFMVDLKGKTAVVTGGGGVLCGLFSKALAGCGAKVAVLDIIKENAVSVADGINKSGGAAIGLQADVLDRTSLEEAGKQIKSIFGKCSILINGAGGNHPRGTTTREYLFPEDMDDNSGITTFFDLDPEGVGFVFDLNFLGTLIPTQVFARDMCSFKDSVIINISSMNAFTPLTKIPAYSAAKAAVSNFTKWLAVHMSKVGIRVNAIAPGFFITDQNRAMLVDQNGGYTGRAGKILDMTPMGRFGEAEELLGTLLWLADPKASGFVNGAVIPVDGGFSAYSGV